MREIKKLSIVIPVYYNENNLIPLYKDLKEKVISKIDYDYEIIFVNDGSGDKSYEIICQLSKEDEHIRGISLSRNFGSHAAILCGLAECSGECAIVKAADLQEPSELIHEMVETWQQGNNVVLAVRSDRQEGLSQTFFANMYYGITRKFALQNMPEGGFDVYLVDRKVIEVLKSLDERNSALTGQILWSGFKTARVEYVRLAREIGKSRWTLAKKVRLVADTLFSFSSLPITMVSFVGFFSFAGGLIWAVVVLICKLLGMIDVSGWTTLFIFNLFSFGVIMLTLGILGNYLWRSYDASRNRPPYIIEETTEERGEENDKLS